ncbi:hypothetical protein [Pseudonocardia oceani]|uniref:Roadblock/LAMTOR2 domain-containing protein n=1 Tax=Pseudonocardia oceani TaxID=2792013 RepID=A0ABS6UJC4_9PSEU|nr:hypothetical protein [Pseudonocardia oceani]MBW0092657.1 hypothetical protein [Pseudonocardia oceani]MBW0112046.1 hypothetical protein [Pseudonocardia oceani]MBW0132340.1 hypothetical protein [Pseudonocardia oceani]
MNVRTDGLRAVLGPLLRDRRVRSAVLVDVDSGMLLDGCSADLELPELEVLGAGHADLVRTALAGADGSGPACELVLTRGDGHHHVLRTVPDPHGDRLALAVVVSGGRLAVERTRRRLGVVSAPALTAGPSMTRRPDAAGWSLPVGPVPVPVAAAAGPAAAGLAGPAPATAPAAPAPWPGSGSGGPGAGPDGSQVGSGRADGGRVDAALLTLGGFARPAPDPGTLRPGPPVLRAVPPPAPGALFVSTVPSPPARPPVPPAPRSPLGPPAARPAPRPTPLPRPSSAPVVPSVGADADRPPAPLSALAPGQRREEPAGER